MIRHICMFKLKNKDDVPAVLAKTVTLEEIPQIRSFLVVTNDSRTPEKNYDLSLIFDFDSVEDLNIYRDSEPHLAFRQFITPLRELRACIDYEF
ncbi:MAG: Dabb family protein [Oscillospiraceae bacterium]|nr:Dabb family protein [Oscillospiraceae bacterium]